MATPKIQVAQRRPDDERPCRQQGYGNRRPAFFWAYASGALPWSFAPEVIRPESPAIAREIALSRVSAE